MENGDAEVTRTRRTVVSRTYESSGGGGQQAISRAYASSGAGQQVTDIASSAAMELTNGNALSLGMGGGMYDMSNTMNTMVSDITLNSSSSIGAAGGYSGSGVNLDRDLSSFKKRIDANTEEQREHADMMAGLQRKVEEYRRRIGDIENQISTGRAEEKVTFNIKEMSGDWVPDVNVVSNQYEFNGQLEEERRRNEELCMTISQLQSEIQRMHQQYEMNLHDKDKMSVTRERNLAQYLSEEQKKMMDLWAELQQVRRQFSEYKDQTARDLQVQRDEFTRVTRNVGGVVRKLSITNLGESQGSDSELVDAIKRFSEQQTLPGGTSTEDYDALMKKYEESIERIVELESRGDGSIGKVAALENELRRTKDKLIECQEALHKIHETTKESKRTDITKRTRSLSPGGTHEVPSEVVRSVRFAIRSRDNELQQLMRKLKNTEMQITEMVTRFESAEETCKRLERQLTDSKREINNQQKALDDATREVRRLEDRLRGADSEKTVAENARVKLEEEIRRLKLVIDQSAVDGERLMLEEAENQKRIIEEEYKIRIAELMRKIDTVQDDNKRLKGDLSGVKDKYRNLEIEYNTTVRKIDEKDVAIRHLEDLKGDLLKDLENQRARFDAVTSELDNLQTHYDTTSKNTVVIEMTVKELKQQRDDVMRQKDDLAHQLADVMHKMEIEIKKREDIEKQSLRHLSEVEKLKAEITEFESEIMLLRRHNDELDTQLSTSQAKISTLENSLASAQKEITKLNEINAKLQREKQDILNTQQKAEATVDTLKERVRKLEQEIEKFKIENKNLLDNEEKAKIAFKEATNKVYALERELHDAKVEIDELRRKLGQLDEANRERLEIALKTRPSESGVYETTTITEVRVKELADQHKMDVERIENDRDDLLRRLRLLEDELAEKQRIIERQQTENDDLRREYQAEIERLKAELINIETKLTSELEDERDQHIREVDALRATEEDLRNKITLLEKKLDDTLNREKRLKDEVIEWEGKYDALTKEVQKLHDDMETIRIDAEKEIQKWKTEAYTAQTEVKNLEATNDTLKSQLAAANDRVSSLNKTINEQAAKMRELSSTVRRLEEELADAKATISTLEGDLESALTRLRSVEEQYATAQATNNKLRVENDNLNRQIDLLKNTNAAHESEIERLKKKVVQLTDINKEQTVELEKLRTERDQLDKAYRDKARQVEQMSDVIKTLETKVDRLRQELQILNDKLIVVETERNNLTSQVTKLERELNLIRDQLKRKTDEFNAALEELSNAHRVSEDGRINAIQELETRKFEISDLRSRLDNAEQRLAALQQEYLNADRERDLLQDSLRRFQSVISRSVIPEGGVVDVQSIDVHVQKLLTRIDKLERERNDYRDTLGRMQRKAGESVNVNQSTTLYHSIEERIADVEEGKRSAEVKLASAKELLRSQEDALKKRDEERRTMRSKINAIELETRGKEAQIRHLNEMVKTLKVDLQNAQSESRIVRDREEKYEVRPLQSKVHDDSDERISMITSTFDLEREKLNETVKKLSTKLQSSESKCADLKDDADRLKKDILKYERIEVELRRSLEEQTRLAREGQRFRDQLTMAQSDLANANNRKQQLDSELMNVRSELRDQKQRYHDATSRIADLERQIQSSMADKNRLNDKINELEKTVANQRNTENDLRHQLTNANAERKALQNELDDLRRRIGNFENEKRGTTQKVEELVRIRITLIKRIEILETEKRSAQALINETASQREAIEKSLNALERENKELCRNCTHLQQQIAQLEMDNGNRLITLTNKQKQEHERFVQSVKAEKAQVERIVENRDRTHKNRIRQLEAQLSQMRDQMNSDRLRRRDTFVGDVNRIGTTSLALTSNVEASAFPQTNSLDYVIGNRNAFSSYYTVPSGYSPASSDIYKASSASISLGQPVEAESSRQTYTTSYHLSGFGSTGGSSNVASSAMGRAVELGDGEMSKQTTVTVRKTTQYEE